MPRVVWLIPPSIGWFSSFRHLLLCPQMREVLEKFLDDDEDMHDMNLTAKEQDAQEREHKREEVGTRMLRCHAWHTRCMLWLGIWLVLCCSSLCCHSCWCSGNTSG